MKYKNLTVLFKNNPNSTDVLDGGTYKLEFNDAVISLGSNHIIITTHSEDGESVMGQVFPLNTVHSYKASR